jgi:hypothetical protein
MKSLITTNILETSEQIGLFTDASNIGFKDIFGNKWFFSQWTNDMSKYHITLKELFPIVLALEILGIILKTGVCIFTATTLQSFLTLTSKREQIVI